MEETEKIRKTIASLENRTEFLEKRIDRLTGRVDQFPPRTTAIMREGIPLEIFTRMSLLEKGFEVHNIYPYEYYNRSNEVVERSVDIYASKDSVYKRVRGGNEIVLNERNHLLVEIKQRKIGVEWVFSSLPRSMQPFSYTKEPVPVVDVAFELRPNETGQSANANPKDIANAIWQLNQSYMPFYVGLLSNDEITGPGYMRKYRQNNCNDIITLLLVTNAKLKIFNPPSKFSDIDDKINTDGDLFKDVPWLVYQPEPSLSLKYHNEKVIERSKILSELEQNDEDRHIIEATKNESQQVYVVNFEHLSLFFDHISDPPRIEAIHFGISVDGGPSTNFTIGGEDSEPRS